MHPGEGLAAVEGGDGLLGMGAESQALEGTWGLQSSFQPCSEAGRVLGPASVLTVGSQHHRSLGREQHLHLGSLLPHWTQGGKGKGMVQLPTVVMVGAPHSQNGPPDPPPAWTWAPLPTHPAST